MAPIPQPNPIKTLLEKHLIPNDPRGHLGYSQLGHPCKRKLWYDFHWAYSAVINPRVARIFRRGDIEEELVVSDLEEAGLTVSGSQLEVSDSTGHVRGHIDGLVCGVPGYDDRLLLEVKTMNKERYNEYIKKGLKETNPGYYVQYNMYLGSLKLKKCLYIVVNKNNEERDYQIYDFDEQCYKDHRRVGFDIIAATEPPKKIGMKTWYVCKMCDAAPICHNGIPPRNNCRTCKHVSIEMQGEWHCRYDGADRELSLVEQEDGCDHFERMASLNVEFFT